MLRDTKGAPGWGAFCMGGDYWRLFNGVGFYDKSNLGV